MELEYKYIEPKTVCRKCILDDSVPNIWFDEKGECNYCKLHTMLDKDNPNDERGTKKLQDIAAKIKEAGKRNKYDVIVGVSGGTDSTYLLHLCAELGLKPLAVHLDNGWNTAISVNNLYSVLDTLKIDLYTYVINWKEFQSILLAQLKSGLPWADAPTDIAIVSSLYKIAAKFDIPYVFVGNNFRTEGKQPTQWTYTDGKLLKYISKKHGQVKFDTYPNLTMSQLIYYTMYKRIKMIRPFYYIKYDKSEAKKLIKQKYNWRDYGGHHHENIFTRYVIGVWLSQKFDIDKRKVTLSAYVRNNELTRDEALTTMKTPPYSKKLMQEDHAYIAKKLGITVEDFDKIWAINNRSFLDYPSYYPLYQKMKWIFNMFFKYMFTFKPMVSYNYENKKL